MTKILTYEIEIDSQTENRLVVARVFEVGEIYCEFWVNRCKQLCLEWINNKVLLYSAGNNTQYLVIMKKNMKTIYIYIYI